VYIEVVQMYGYMYVCVYVCMQTMHACLTYVFSKVVDYIVGRMMWWQMCYN